MRYYLIFTALVMIVSLAVVFSGVYSNINWIPMVPEGADKNTVADLLYRMKMRAEEARSSLWLMFYIMITVSLVNIGLFYVITRKKPIVDK